MLFMPGGQYLAVGVSGYITISPDAVNWTLQVNNTFYLKGAAYGSSNKYVVSRFIQENP